MVSIYFKCASPFDTSVGENTSAFLIYAWAASKWENIPLIIAPRLNYVTKTVIKYGIPFESSIWMEKENIMFKTRKKKK